MIGEKYLQEIKRKLTEPIDISDADLLAEILRAKKGEATRLTALGFQRAYNQNPEKFKRLNAQAAELLLNEKPWPGKVFFKNKFFHSLEEAKNNV
jgi:hypothetical protein